MSILLFTPLSLPPVQGSRPDVCSVHPFLCICIKTPRRLTTSRSTPKARRRIGLIAVFSPNTKRRRSDRPVPSSVYGYTLRFSLSIASSVSWRARNDGRLSKCQWKEAPRGLWAFSLLTTFSFSFSLPLSTLRVFTRLLKLRRGKRKRSPTEIGLDVPRPPPFPFPLWRRGFLYVCTLDIRSEGKEGVAHDVWPVDATASDVTGLGQIGVVCSFSGAG